MILSDVQFLSLSFICFVYQSIRLYETGVDHLRFLFLIYVISDNRFNVLNFFLFLSVYMFVCMERYIYFVPLYFHDCKCQYKNILY
jgi:hypothetical protein